MSSRDASGGRKQKRKARDSTFLRTPKGGPVRGGGGCGGNLGIHAGGAFESSSSISSSTGSTGVGSDSNGMMLSEPSRIAIDKGDRRKGDIQRLHSSKTFTLQI